ncbi:hypothetical protein THIOSC13_470007 [uncultured Thiomicrorhabdus sp.]
MKAFTSSKLIAVLTMLLAVSFFILVVQYLVSNAMLSTAKQRIESWSFDHQPSKRQLHSVIQTLSSAQLWSPLENEKIYLWSARAYQWQAIYYSQNAGNKNHIVNALSKASDFYQKQMLLKANSFQALSGYIQMQLSMGQMSDRKLYPEFKRIKELQGVNSSLHFEFIQGVVPLWKKMTTKQKVHVLFDVKWLINSSPVFNKKLINLFEGSAVKPEFCKYQKIVGISEKFSNSICK